MKTVSPYKPLQFFAITFLFTWTFWFVSAYASRQEEGKTLFIVLLLLGLLVPFLAALWMIFSSKNRELRRVFCNKLFNIRLISPASIPAILFIPPLSVILSIALSLLFGYSSEQFTISSSFSFSIGSMPTLLILFLAASFEELGWRGYGMESLTGKTTYFKATAIFAALWSLWHFPLFFVEQSYQREILLQNPVYAVNFMVSIIPLAFIISWLCKKNSSSILAAVLLHFVVNIAQEFFMVEPATKCIQTFVLTAIAAVIVMLNKEMFFQKPSIARTQP